MRKTITAALAAITLGGALIAAAAPAAAEEHWRGHGGWDRGGWGYGGWGHRDHDGGGAAIFAGVAGLALGAALADSHPGYYYDRAPGYYYGDPYYGRPYATCYGSREVWDPYLGHYIVQRTAYAC